MKKLYAIVISLLFVGSFFGVASILGAQYTSFGANPYRVYDANYNWIEIKDTGTEVVWANAGDNPLDDDYVKIDIGFDFPFYGETYNQLYLSTNGHIDFSSGVGNYASYNYYGYKIPTESYSIGTNYWGENPLIAFLFYDMSFKERGNAYYQNFGDYLVIEFDAAGMYYGEGTNEGAQTVQVILYKNGNIKMQYKNITNIIDDHEHPPVIGLDLDDVTGVSYDGPIRNGLALWFTTGADPDPKSLPIAQILKILKENQEN
ncbi:MAG: hypothetical protein KO464_03620 [Candidatus Methanofastidiosum sp.]|nr:hypothetical protein [Methanofastidiosum sp.]